MKLEYLKAIENEIWSYAGLDKFLYHWSANVHVHAFELINY